MSVFPSHNKLDLVIGKTHYNPQVFSAIVEDFEDFIAGTNPGAFYNGFCQWAKIFTEADQIRQKMTTDKLEKGLKELKKRPEIYREDFHQLAAILECDDPEEEFDKWFDQLPFYLHIFYETVIGILWSRNSRRYTTALGDTGKASLL